MARILLRFTKYECSDPSSVTGEGYYKEKLGDRYDLRGDGKLYTL